MFVIDDFNNTIHKTAVIDSSVKLGRNNWIGPFTVLTGNLEIGNDNWLAPHVVIGCPPEHKSFHVDVLPVELKGKIVIGDRNKIHEHTAIQMPTSHLTEIGDDCFLMHGTHIGHDCKVGHNVVMAPNSVLAGHVRVQEFSNLGIGVQVHQYRIIGGYSMIGMGSTVTRDIHPFMIAFGSPCMERRLNLVGIERNGIQKGGWLQNLDVNKNLVIEDSTPQKVKAVLAEFENLRAN
jgi:UDP-N-acetylglucosamine acyltransferase